MLFDFFFDSFAAEMLLRVGAWFARTSFLSLLATDVILSWKARDKSSGAPHPCILEVYILLGTRTRTLLQPSLLERRTLLPPFS